VTLHKEVVDSKRSNLHRQSPQGSSFHTLELRPLGLPLSPSLAALAAACTPRPPHLVGGMLEVEAAVARGGAVVARSP
jgi:hypothetical protein